MDPGLFRPRQTADPRGRKGKTRLGTPIDPGQEQPPRRPADRGADGQEWGVLPVRYLRQHCAGLAGSVYATKPCQARASWSLSTRGHRIVNQRVVDAPTSDAPITPTRCGMLRLGRAARATVQACLAPLMDVIQGDAIKAMSAPPAAATRIYPILCHQVVGVDFRTTPTPLLTPLRGDKKRGVSLDVATPTYSSQNTPSSEVGVGSWGSAKNVPCGGRSEATKKPPRRVA